MADALVQPGSDITLRIVRLRNLEVPDYQRDRRRTADSVSKAYDPDLYQPIEVSERANGSYWVIDGAQRRQGEIERLNDAAEVIVRVHRGLNVAREVELFEKLNRERVQVSTFDIARAQRIAGERDAVALFEAVEACGLQLAKQHGSRQVGSVKELQRLQTQWDDGLYCIKLALNTLTEAWGHEHGTYHAALVSGLATFYHLMHVQEIKPRRGVSEVADTLRKKVDRYDVSRPGGGNASQRGMRGTEIGPVLVFIVAWNKTHRAQKIKHPALSADDSAE